MKMEHVSEISSQLCDFSKIFKLTEKYSFKKSFLLNKIMFSSDITAKITQIKKAPIRLDDLDSLPLAS